jgi:TRAP-type C4-dicarboxylate transport system substrate-binding protein
MNLCAGGYQGQASILTASMHELCATLIAQGGPWADLTFTPNVTAQGESAQSLFDSVEQGRRHLCYLASGYLSHRVSELNILDLPFAHAKREVFFDALDAQGGVALAEAVARKTGFRVLGFWDNGQRHVSNAVWPVRSPADAQGLRLRTLDSALYRRSLQAMGFDAMTCDVKDLVAWAAQGLVHAQENPLTNYLGFELWRHHRYVSLTGHFRGALLLVCPEHWYQALPREHQDQLNQAAVQATQRQRERAAGEDARALQRLSELDIELLGPNDLDLTAFQHSVRDVQRDVLQTLPPEVVRPFFGMNDP